MAERGPIASANLVAFIATRDRLRSRDFYESVLGLELVSEDQFAIVFNAGGTMLRVVTVQEVSAAKYTVLGWSVTSIEETVDELLKRGVQFERYAMFQQDSRAIWTAPSGARIAWFKDPDRNLLSVSQH